MTVMITMPWKFTAGLSLALSVTVLAVAPLLTPARRGCYSFRGNEAGYI